MLAQRTELRPVKTAIGLHWSALDIFGSLLPGLRILSNATTTVVQDARGHCYRIDDKGYMTQYMGDFPVMTAEQYATPRKERIKQLLKGTP